MSRTLRISLVMALVAVLAFVVLRPDDAPDTVAESTPEDAVTQDPAPDADAEPTPTPTPRPQPPLLIADATRTLTFERGDTIRLRFVSDVAEEVHIHGFDRFVDVPAGGTRTVRFAAALEGIYEVESHGSGELLAKLEIRPK